MHADDVFQDFRTSHMQRQGKRSMRRVFDLVGKIKTKKLSAKGKKLTRNMNLNLQLKIFKLQFPTSYFLFLYQSTSPHLEIEVNDIFGLMIQPVFSLIYIHI